MPDPAPAPILVLFGADLARALGTSSVSGALRAVRREGIPHVRIGRRVGVRIAALDEWLKAREVATAPRPSPPPIPEAPAWAKALLERRRGGGKRS